LGEEGERERSGERKEKNGGERELRKKRKFKRWRRKRERKERERREEKV